MDTLKKSKDYETAYTALEEYEKCVSSIEPMRSTIDKIKTQLVPANETLNSPEVLKLALGDDELSREISRGLDDSIRQIDNFKNLSSLNEINEMNTGILRDSLEEIKSGVETGTADFETRIDPNARIFTIIGIGILLIIIVAGVIFVKRRGAELKAGKEEEVITGVGDITIVVIESKTRDPVGNAGVTLTNSKTKNKYTGTTESNGNLFLKDLVTGEYELKIVSKKHETEQMTINLDSGANRSMIVLKRK
jgi:hypothetical protein